MCRTCGARSCESDPPRGPPSDGNPDHGVALRAFVDAFYRIAQDRANKIVILTGAGGEFIPDIDFASFGYGLSLEGASAADLVQSMKARS